MKGRMQKTLSRVNDCPQRARTESEWYEGVQTRKGYWRIADSVILKRAIPNISLKVAGYPCLTDLYFKWNPK